MITSAEGRRKCGGDGDAFSPSVVAAAVGVMARVYMRRMLSRGSTFHRRARSPHRLATDRHCMR